MRSFGHCCSSCHASAASLSLRSNERLLFDVGVLHELLCDRRAAFDDRAVPHVLPDGAGDAADVDAAVLEEAAVLDGDDRLLHDVRDLVGLHDDSRSRRRGAPPARGRLRV